MDKKAKIYIAGHKGMVGSALLRALRGQGYENLLLRGSSKLDLRDCASVGDFFREEKPDYVLLAAAKVGGIHANMLYGGEFIYDNLMIQSNVIHNAMIHGVKKLLFLGSSCIYPRMSPQPIKEEYMLTGPLEPTNEPYAVAKIAGIRMCQAYHQQYDCNFISVMPTNLYGPEDNYHPENSHVFAALIRKFYEAARDGKAEVEIWGDGSPYREFLHVEDMARACLHLMHHYDSPELVNIGTGQDVTIADLAHQIAAAAGFEGKLRFDPSKPKGTPRKLLDVSRLNATGFRPELSLEEGIRLTLADFEANYARYCGG